MRSSNGPCTWIGCLHIWKSEMTPLPFSAEYGDIFMIKALGRNITYVTSPKVRETGNILRRSVLADP